MLSSFLNLDLLVSDICAHRKYRDNCYIPKSEISMLCHHQAVLLERTVSTYEVSERLLLGSVCSIVRFLDEPQKLGIEWSDGTPPTLYISPSRDAIVAAILDACQVQETHTPLNISNGFYVHFFFFLFTEIPWSQGLYV